MIIDAFTVSAFVAIVVIAVFLLVSAANKSTKR